MRIRANVLAALAALAALGQAGCATIGMPPTAMPNPLIVPSSDFELVWKKTVEVVDEYFDIRLENRTAGQIVTDPKISATLLEPWLGDAVGFDDRLEATLQTVRRRADVTVRPAAGGGYTVKIEVHKELEDLVRPAGQSMGRAVFNNDFPINRTREVVGPMPLPVQWIDRGRDEDLERVILCRLRKALYL